MHARHLNGITDTGTLFLLSADATPEDVREWFTQLMQIAERFSNRQLTAVLPSSAEVLAELADAGCWSLWKCILGTTFATVGQSPGRAGCSRRKG